MYVPLSGQRLSSDILCAEIALGVVTFVAEHFVAPAFPDELCLTLIARAYHGSLWPARQLTSFNSPSLLDAQRTQDLPGPRTAVQCLSKLGNHHGGWPVSGKHELDRPHSGKQLLLL